MPAVIVMVYALLGLAANLPVLPWNGSQMRQGDPTEVTWDLVWSPWSVLHGLNPFYTNYMNYPRGMNLAQNTTAPLLGSGWVLAPVTFAINPIASLNMLQWLAFALTATSMFFVASRLLRQSNGAFLAASSYRFVEAPVLKWPHRERAVNLAIGPLRASPPAQSTE